MYENNLTLMRYNELNNKKIKVRRNNRLIGSYINN